MLWRVLQTFKPLAKSSPEKIFTVPFMIRSMENQMPPNARADQIAEMY